jgi:hypothetical protein
MAQFAVGNLGLTVSMASDLQLARRRPRRRHGKLV